MAKITISIEADNPADFRSTLQALLSDVSLLATSEPPATPEPAKPAKGRKVAESKPCEPVVAEEPAPAADPVAETQELPPTPATDPAPIVEKTYTQVELREAIQTLRGDVVRRLVAELCGKAPDEKLKLSDVPAEKHADLVGEAHRLAQLPENVKQGATNE